METIELINKIIADYMDGMITEQEAMYKIGEAALLRASAIGGGES